ncbi:hypothetical protein ACIBJC_35995 [Streptomyces sp. NPDC050509]|uniref:hypothetical protein n=1 Tax=Streptomyces sp. NPDC050509 TaxID=3365620 RepID=UPI0037B81300
MKVPATVVSLGGAVVPAAADAHVHLAGLVDLRAASALLLGALPVIAVLRRRPPRIPDRTHAWAYIGLPAVVTVAMLGVRSRATTLPPWTPPGPSTGEFRHCSLLGYLCWCSLKETFCCLPSKRSRPWGPRG